MQAHADDKQQQPAAKKYADKPVVRETYDEIVFWEPAEEFYNRVKHTRPKKAPGEQDPLMPVYREQQEANALLASRNRVAQERADMSAALDQGL
jgi:hypothetical protein